MKEVRRVKAAREFAREMLGLKEGDEDPPVRLEALDHAQVGNHGLRSPCWFSGLIHGEAPMFGGSGAIMDRTHKGAPIFGMLDEPRATACVLTKSFTPRARSRDHHHSRSRDHPSL